MRIARNLFIISLILKSLSGFSACKPNSTNTKKVYNQLEQVTADYIKNGMGVPTTQVYNPRVSTNITNGNFKSAATSVDSVADSGAIITHVFTFTVESDCTLTEVNDFSLIKDEV